MIYRGRRSVRYENSILLKVVSIDSSIMAGGIRIFTPTHNGIENGFDEIMGEEPFPDDNQENNKWW